MKNTFVFPVLLAFCLGLGAAWAKDAPKELDSWAAHEAWKDQTQGGLAALNRKLTPEDAF